MKQFSFHDMSARFKESGRRPGERAVVGVGECRVGGLTLARTRLTAGQLGLLRPLPSQSPLLIQRGWNGLQGSRVDAD